VDSCWHFDLVAQKENLPNMLSYLSTKKQDKGGLLEDITAA
jgi:hypothetical protein